MPSDEVDDTDMTQAAFLAEVERGVPARVVRSRAEYEAAMAAAPADLRPYVLNRHLDLAFAGTQPHSENLPARAHG